MVRCPHCSKEIDALHCVITGRYEYTIAIFKGNIEYDDEHFEGDGIVHEYLCPECSSVVRSSKEQAEAFLKGDSEVFEKGNRENTHRHEYKHVERLCTSPSGGD
ncbi:MAG: hypothetical protein ABIL68_17295 [bacterium]